MALYDAGVGDHVMRIRMNNGTVVDRPYREAVRLLSRRLADPVPEDEHVPPDTVPLDHDDNASDVPKESSGTYTMGELGSFTKPELTEYAKSLGLPVYGNKPDLIGRIYDHLSTTDSVGASAEDEPRGHEVSSDGRA